MYIFTPEGQKHLLAVSRKRPRFPVLVIGMGPDSFIAPAGWLPNMFATGCYDLKYAAASRDPEKLRIAAAEYGLDDDAVSVDYKALVIKAVAAHGNKLVVCICTETPVHYEQIKFCIDNGVKIIFLDKPPVETHEQWSELQALAVAQKVRMLVTYQHTLNAPTEQMALIVAKHLKKYGPDRVFIHGFFLQGWLYEPPMHIRQVWRLLSKWCGLHDIGTHAGDGASVVAGARIKRVLRSSHGMARIKETDKPALDNGRMEVQFENGIRGLIEYHQALPGHADDIGWKVTLINDDGTKTHLMFRMEWGPEALFQWTDGESLWGGGVDGDINARTRWVPHLRGNSPLFDGAVNDAYGKNPPGHYQGWDFMWWIFFLRAYRECLIHTGDSVLAEKLRPFCMGRVPSWEENGGNSMAFVNAAIKCAEEHTAITVA